MDEKSTKSLNEPSIKKLIDPTCCPLCSNDNQCGILIGLPIEECWCSRTPIPKELLKQIPIEQRNKSCVCQKCAEKFTG